MARVPGTSLRPGPPPRAGSAPRGDHAASKPTAQQRQLRAHSATVEAVRGPAVRRPATPTVTEHTHGQLRPSAADTRYGLQVARRAAAHAGSGTPLAPGDAGYLAAHPARSIGRELRTPARLLDSVLLMLGGLDRVGIDRGALPHDRLAEQSMFSQQAATATGKALAHSVAQDVTDPLHHKLNLALDAAALLSGGATAVGKGVQVAKAVRGVDAWRETRTGAALRALHTPLEPAHVLPRALLPDETGLRKLRVSGGEVQVPNQSRNLVTAAAQHAADRLSERIPDVRGIGAKARAAHHLTGENQTRLMRLTAQAMPLEEAARKLRSVRGVTPREMAYTVAADYGHTGPEGAALLDKEIALRQGQIAKATGKPLGLLQNRVKLLQAARKHVLNPDAELRTALAEGKKLSETVTGSRVARGAMTAATAETAPARHIRITHGATFEKPTPGKLGQESRALKNARMRVTSLQRRREEALAKAKAARVAPNTKAPAEIAREDALVQHIADLKLQHKAVPKGSTAKLQARHDALEAQWGALVDKYAGRAGRTTEQSQRNLGAKARRRKKLDPLPTVNAENRRRAELEVLQVLEHRADDPFVRQWRNRLADLNGLAEELAARSDRANGGIFAETPILHPRKPTTSAALLHEIRLRQAEHAGLAARPSPIDPLASPTLERLGGALSVAKDKLKVAEKTAAARVKPTGLVGAENVKPGPLAFFNPDIEKPTAGARATARSPVSLNPPKEKIHQSTGATFTQAKQRVGPGVTLGSFQKEVRHLDRQARADRALGLSQPYNHDLFDPRQHQLIDPNAARAGRELPRGTKAAVAAEKRSAQARPQDINLDEAMSPGDTIKRLIDDHKAWNEKLFPTAQNIAAEHRTGLRMVDKKIADAISGADVVQRMHANPFFRFLDFSNNVNRTALIYLNPSYGVVQGTGNVLFLGLHQGPALAGNLARYSRTLAKFDRETRRRIDLEVGGGAAAHLAHEGRGAGPMTKLADLQNAIADMGPRRVAWMEEAHKKGYNTEAEIKALLSDKKLEGHLNAVSDRAQQAMVKFRRNPTAVRQGIGRAIFIAPWLEGSTRYLGRLVLDRPITARVANEIRDRISQRQVDKFGKVGKEVTGGFIPVGKAFKKAGIPVIPGFNPDSMSPTSSGLGVIQGLAELPGFVQHPLHGGTRLAGAVQPALSAVATAATRYDPYSGYTYPANRSFPSILREQLVGDTQHPAIPLAATVKTALTKPGPPAGKPTKYFPEAGPMDALKRVAFGSARERLVEQPYVQKQTRTINRAAMNPVQKAQAEGRDLLNKLTVGATHHGLIKPGGQVAPILRRAVKARTARMTNYATLGAKTHADKFKADIALLLTRKVITPPQAQAGLDWLAKGPTSRQIEHQRDLLDPSFYSENGMSYKQILAAAKRELHQAQDAGH